MRNCQTVFHSGWTILHSQVEFILAKSNENFVLKSVFNNRDIYFPHIENYRGMSRASKTFCPLGSRLLLVQRSTNYWLQLFVSVIKFRGSQPFPSTLNGGLGVAWQSWVVDVTTVQPAWHKLFSEFRHRKFTEHGVILLACCH